MDWTLAISVAIGTLGILEWLKVRLEKVPSWTWWVASPVLCVALAIALFYLPLWAKAAVVAIAMTQLGYDLLVKLIKQKIETL